MYRQNLYHFLMTMILKVSTLFSKNILDFKLINLLVLIAAYLTEAAPRSADILG